MTPRTPTTTAYSTVGNAAAGAPTPPRADTDGDGKSDCAEAGDVDGNGSFNFPGDSLAVAHAALVPGFGRTSDLDLNKDGVANFPGDAINSAKRALGVIPC